ncbi:uncharacterized protein LOC110732113 [Chenopodium quinoa]|uniref:uncharacterized protein LOC110732113 n=1 Tax=Chenopodium quinoa TaxID=63459 RepID=UPI000B78E06A|nr:uncharacterized protein LOC110732113 [Chenopodium quinoa]
MQKNSDEGWRIVGRKTESQQTRVNQPASTSNAFVALFTNEMEGAGGFTINPSRGEGLNDPVKVASVKKLLHSHSVDVISLLETKFKLKNVSSYQKKFCPSWLWVCNYDYSPKGRIWIGWNADRVTINVLQVHEQFIHCLVSTRDFSMQIQLTVTYGLHSIHDRLPMWEGIRNLSILHSPLLCAGDFNSMLCSLDRLYGNDVTNYETRDFKSFVDDLNLTEVKSKGAFYSCVSQAWVSDGSVWPKLKSLKSGIKSLNNKQFGNIGEKIDQTYAELTEIQNLMNEFDAIKVVKQRNDIQESIFKQKSRINWIKLGDGNSHYFFSVMKNRQARNRIDSIFDSNQILLKDPDAISFEIISFCKSLLGTKAPWLHVVDLVTMRRGKQLSSAAQSILIQPVSHADIDDAL